jgi:hypothetical protein
MFIFLNTGTVVDVMFQLSYQLCPGNGCGEVDVLKYAPSPSEADLSILMICT